MKLVIFGLTMSSSWGNGHATLWRGLTRALGALGHRVVFFERDTPYYAANRDAASFPACELIIYSAWRDIEHRARREVRDADAAIITSYCQDAAAAHALLAGSRCTRVLYDLDTPVTLDQVRAGNRPDHLCADLGDFDLVLSFAGGAALAALAHLGARHVLPLYGWVDPTVHRPAPPVSAYRGSMSYLGTYAADRQSVLERLLFASARHAPGQIFVLAGSLYPTDLQWPPNVRTIGHLAPGEHPAFFCSSPLTLSITRAPMAALGYAPSGRLFEAAACETPVVTDRWPGLEAFFEPGREIFVADTTEEILDLLARPVKDLRRVGQKARKRALAEHTAHRRAETLVSALSEAA